MAHQCTRRTYPTLDLYFRAMKRTPRSRTDRRPRTGMELADRVGVCYSYISMIRLGYRQPRLDVALRIQSETGVELQSMVVNTEDAA